MRKVNLSNYDNKIDYIYHYIALFFIYGFIGFILETFYRNLINGEDKMVGFLSLLPILPIYGLMGMITYLFAVPLEKLIDKLSNTRNNTIISVFIYLLFFAAVPAILELVGGFTLEHIFHSKEWDYSNQPLNYKGYVSLPYICMFSLLGTFNMLALFYIFDFLLVEYSTRRSIRVLLYTITLLFIIDIIYTIIKAV